MSWMQRLKRVFHIDIEHCGMCGGTLRVIACIETPELVEKIPTHLAARETGSINHPRAPPLHAPLTQPPACLSPALSWLRPRVHPIPAAPRLPCPAISSAFPTCLPVCRLEIASPRPRFVRFVGSRTDVEPDNDRTDTPATITIDALFFLSVRVMGREIGRIVHDTIDLERSARRAEIERRVRGWLRAGGLIEARAP